jgi:23S rRNA (uracil1939-C5)-methyltransferase
MARRNRPRPLLENILLTGIADKGRAVGRTAEGMAIFVEGAVPGDVVDVQVTKKKNSVAEGYTTRIVTPSSDRVTPVCSHFGVCGGCKWQNLTYEAQLRHKEQVVRDALTYIGKVPVKDWRPILGAPQPYHYRNKLEFAFSNKRWLTQEEMTGDRTAQPGCGFHRPGAFDKVVQIDQCHLQPEPSDKIRHFIYQYALDNDLSFYDIRAQEGFLRNMVVRVATTGQVMCLVAFGYEHSQKRTALLDALLEDCLDVTALYYVINTKANDTFLDLPVVSYKGPGYIEERLGHVVFKVGPKSFFQTNTHQAKRLYDVVADFANLTGQENVYDLYTGLGSIALYMAQQAAHVVGIEDVAAAIDDARINAAYNNIGNCTFYAGDVKDILTDDFAAKHGKPDVLITDPPRAGMHAQVVEMLLRLAPPRIVYVSCNPATQARDISLMSAQYEVVRVQPVDMFPHTHHIENVALLQRIDVNDSPLTHLSNELHTENSV